MFKTLIILLATLVTTSVTTKVLQTFEVIVPSILIAVADKYIAFYSYFVWATTTMTVISTIFVFYKESTKNADDYMEMMTLHKEGNTWYYNLFHYLSPFAIVGWILIGQYKIAVLETITLIFASLRREKMKSMIHQLKSTPIGDLKFNIVTGRKGDTL